MRRLFIFSFIFFISCKKNTDTFCNVGLDIGNTQSPTIANTNTGIIFSYECHLPNSCYSFSKTLVTKTPGNGYEIRALGNIPCKADVCLDIFRIARDTIKLNTPTAGTYYLQFYNNNVLSKTDTIVVN